ncbi:MAG: NlpC/P60 family protein [Fermentimonas sp.]|nr:NlpC/P60 family protein [Fermentimonas sp.]MDD4696424.1 NlpC/P60 family protein [Fermentimonas sp.]
MDQKVFSVGYLIKLVSISTLIVLLASCGAGRTGLSRKSTATPLQKDVLDFSKKYLGKPYRYAGKGPNSFDCSGFTSFVFKEFGFRLNSSSAGQDKQFPSITQKEKLNKGDLVFFEGSRRNGRVGHVGIVTETFPNGEFRFIHASTTSGVIISESTEPYYASRYIRGGRVLEENSFTEVKKQTRSESIELTPKPLTPAIVIVTQTDQSKNPELLNQQSRERRREQKETVPVVKSDVVLPKETAIVPPPTETHIVQPGETLYSISKKYSCSVEQIKKWNPHLDSILKAGEKLNILPGIN